MGEYSTRILLNQALIRWILKLLSIVVTKSGRLCRYWNFIWIRVRLRVARSRLPSGIGYRIIEDLEYQLSGNSSVSRMIESCQQWISLMIIKDSRTQTTWRIKKCFFNWSVVDLPCDPVIDHRKKAFRQPRWAVQVHWGSGTSAFGEADNLRLCLRSFRCPCWMNMSLIRQLRTKNSSC